VSSEEWLDRIGSEYLARVEAEEPQFLIEIDVPDERLEELFDNIAKAGTTRWTRSKRICLALAAVHSAARADQHEDSFREVFYGRLGRELNQSEWENNYGSQIAAFLRDWFDVEVPASGPYRYVGAVYRHAGVPLPARLAFCRLLSKLLQEALSFTRAQYDEAVQEFPSSVARGFLESGAGYDFTQKTAHLIARLDNGQISRTELEAFPAYRRNLYETVLSEVHDIPSGHQAASKGWYAAPILALDIAARRLVIKFDSHGVVANAYRTTSGAVYYATQAVRGPDPPCYCIKPETEWTAISPWWVPGKSESALFRVGDGALVGSSGVVPAGHYYLVTSAPESIPSEMIREEGVFLECDDADALGVYYSIVLVELPQGADLPDFSIRVRGSVAPPTLEFTKAEKLRHAIGGDVFVGSLPDVHISNWTAGCNDKYWLWMDDGAGEKRLDPSADGGVALARVACPSRGSIWLEPKNHIRDTFSPSCLTYTIVPDGIYIQTVEPISGLYEPTRLQIQLPPGWSFEPKSPLRKESADLWTIPNGERLVEGTLSSLGIRIPVSLRVARAVMRFQCHRGSGAVVWHQDASQELPIVIEGLPNARCLIFLENDQGCVLICDAGDLNPSGSKRISLAFFRDALATCGMPAAEFRLQLGEYFSTPTHRYFASSAAIEQVLGSEPLESILFRLPDVGREFLCARQLFDNTLPHFTVTAALDVPESLRSFLCGLAYAASAFDLTVLQDDIEEYRKAAPASVRSVVDWLKKAEAAARTVGNEDELLAEYPSDDVARLPVARWQELLKRRARQIRLNQDIPELIRAWRLAIEDPINEQKSALVLRAGGQQLTDAVRKYHDGLVEHGKLRNEILTRAIVGLRRLVGRGDLDPVIGLIAPVFLQLAYYHSDRLEDAAAIAIPCFPRVLERAGKAMQALAAHCRGAVPIPWSGRGIGFEELSTRKEDARLEGEIGRSCPGITTV
jgi:hypothetical protein